MQAIASQIIKYDDQAMRNTEVFCEVMNILGLLLLSQFLVYDEAA